MKVCKKIITNLLIVSLCITMFLPVAAAEADMIVLKDSEALDIRLIGRYVSGAELDEGGTEIVAYDKASHRMFSVNGDKKSLDIIDLSSLESGQEVKTIDLLKRVELTDINQGIGAIDDITSVAKSPTQDYIAIAVTADPKQEAGYIVFLDVDGAYLNHVRVGALPDMVTYTPDGLTVLVANEGEPNDDYTVNPKGTVSLIDVSGDIKSLSNDQVTELEFDESMVDEQVRKVYEDASIAEDLEPEYIVVSKDSQKAYVVLQENNSIATIDIPSKTVEKINGLGYKDWSIGNNKMDASNKDDKVNIQNWPVLSMYQPDGLSLLEVEGKTYLLTPNEGDAADYDGFSEETRVADIADQYALNADLFEGYTQEALDELVANGLFDEDQLGRLTTTTSAPMNEEGYYEAVYGYGARSFSIWDTEDMSLVYDSGSDFETITEQVLGDNFNTTNTENEFDNRSDDKGPEPETVTVGNVGGHNYAFVGLERTSGIMVYDLTQPEMPEFVQYFSSRDFSSDEVAGDVAPEGITFVPALDSPTGKALLLVAHEVSGTIAVYEITPEQSIVSIVHVNDVHSRVFDGPGFGYAKLQTLIKEQTSKNVNTLFFDAGDTFHGQTFASLVEGESILAVLNAMGLDAMVAGNHDFNYGTDHLLELAAEADFPILGANVKEGETSVLEESIIFEVDGLEIGVFGLATPETAYKTHPKNVENITFVDPVMEAEAQVAALMEAEVDVIVALSHLGTDASSVDTSEKVANEVEGIDLIIDGHSHEVRNYKVKDTLIVQTGEYSENVGITDLIFEDGQLVAIEDQLISYEDNSEIAADSTIENMIASIENEQSQVLGEVVGHTDAFLDGERATVRANESNLGNLITDAMLYVTQADVAITNGGGIRASIDEGPITKGEIITVLPFGNYVVTMEVTGEEIMQALQLGASDYPEVKGAFPHVAGLTYSLDGTRPVGDKVVEAMIKGAPIELDKTYVLATNDFMAAGGDEYTMFADNAIIGHYQGLDEAVIEYITSIGTVDTDIEGRIVNVGPATEVSENDTTTTDPSEEVLSYTVKKGDTLSEIGEMYGVDWEILADYNDISNPHLIHPEQVLSIPEQ